MKQFTQTVTSNDADSSPLSFDEVLEAARSIDPAPVTEVQVGKKYYEKLLLDVASYKPGNPKKPSLLTGSIGELYGIPVKLNYNLRPNEYRFVQDGKIIEDVEA